MRAILEKFGLEALIGPISRIHGTILDARAPYGDITIIPVYHPAAALYNPELKQELLVDFQNLKKILE